MAFFPILQGPLTGPTPADRITPLWPLVPPLSLCVLFASSTHLTEAISASKYPRAYAAYQQRVGMFSPVVTAVKGVWLAVRGSKARADELVWGDSTKQFAGEISERTPLVNGSR